jgi:hypothetical protein
MGTFQGVPVFVMIIEEKDMLRAAKDSEKNCNSRLLGRSRWQKDKKGG